MICLAASPTLRDFLKTVYVPSRLELGRDSVRQMEISIGRLEAWAGRTLTLADLDEDLLRQFLASYRADHSPATTNSKRCQLLALWRCAWEEEYLESPPRAGKIRRAKAEPNIVEAWSAEEVGRILDAAAQTPGAICGILASAWWESLIYVFYDTGERRGAMMKTAAADLSLAGGWIVFRQRKTKAPRWCPLSTEAIAACRAVYDPARPLMWPWPFTREWLDKSFKAILRRAGVAFGRDRGGCFHKLKRSSGTLVEANGGDGARHTGTTRTVFERHYRDPRFFGHHDLDRLPRPARSAAPVATIASAW